MPHLDAATFFRQYVAMPELPEVETIVGEICRAQVAGHRIAAVKVYWNGCISAETARSFIRNVTGKSLAAVWRRGKYLVFDLAGGGALLLHLRMSGRLRIDPLPGAYDRLALVLDDGRMLRFSDPRKFGRWRRVADVDTVLSALGPEPFERKLTPRRFHERLCRGRRRIKTVLLDQTVVAGAGNIYADEALWQAGIHPERCAAALTVEEAGRLLTALRRVLRQAIAHRGSSLGSGATNYAGLDGRHGKNQQRLQVYRRTGQPCLRCGRAIERKVVGQRGTHWCPNCQKS